MNAPRYLCSQLVELTVDGQSQWVNLEEIWESGALMESEGEVPAGVPAHITASSIIFEGRISDVRPEEFGWRVEIEFSAATPWSAERWKPDHMLDPRTLKHAE